jgi:hypothetical protein
VPGGLGRPGELKEMQPLAGERGNIFAQRANRRGAGVQRSSMERNDVVAVAHFGAGIRHRLRRFVEAIGAVISDEASAGVFDLADERGIGDLNFVREGICFSGVERTREEEK